MKAILIAFVGCLCATMGFTQTSTLFNTGSSGDYLGWDNMTGIDLDIKTEAATNIRFLTSNILHGGITGNGGILLGVTMIQNGANVSVGNNSLFGSENVAVRGEVDQAQDITGIYGAYFEAQFGNASSLGIRGRAYGGNTSSNYGVAARVCNNSPNSVAYAIYGRIKNGCAGSSWALYLEGPTFTPGAAWSGSDENLKTNIQNLEGGTDIVNNLNPKSYEFDSSISYMPLPEGTQYGLLAQELAEVIPHAVTEVIDSELGSEEIVANEFLAVNYQQLIPVLISAFQDRQTQLDEQQELITQLEQAIEAAETQISQIAID